MLVEQNTSQKVAQMNDISCSGKDIGSAMPKLSVIVPVYNVENYLPKCLDSIIHQTMKDIEIICINDASEDYTVVKEKLTNKSQEQLDKERDAFLAQLENANVLPSDASKSLDNLDENELSKFSM